MKIDNRIFNEIQYISAEHDQHCIYHDADTADDYDVIEGLVRKDNPIQADESEADYDDRIADEMDDYPMIGLIDNNSLLAACLQAWEAAGHPLALESLGIPGYESDQPRYFLTRDSNYDLTHDLFNDNTDRSKIVFLKYINAID